MVTAQAQHPRAAVQASAFPVRMCPEPTAEGPAGRPSGKPSLQPAWRFLSRSPQKVGGNDSFARLFVNFSPGGSSAGSLSRLLP